MKKSLDHMAKAADVIASSRIAQRGVFKQLPGSKSADGTKSIEKRGMNNLIPVTQQSQNEARTVKETWNKPIGKGVYSVDGTDWKEKFGTLFIETKNGTFAGWSLREIASFLSRNVLNSIAKTVDHSQLSRITSGRKFPSLAIRNRVQDLVANELPKRTVDDENNVRKFQILPGVENRLFNLIKSPAPAEQLSNILAPFGDSSVALSDILMLVVPDVIQLASYSSSSHRVTDEALNLYANLLARSQKNRKC